jgi:hypothetical protein
MKDPKIKTQVVHSQSKSAWNVIGTIPGRKYKIARVPYFVIGNDVINTRERKEAFEYAEFINWCFNNSTKIINSTMKDYIVKEDMICPTTNEHCDDECCPVGAICNLKGEDDGMSAIKKDNPQSAIKEQVDWDEAWKKYNDEWGISTHGVFIDYIKENYSLIPKPKPCNENTTSETKN